MLLVSRVCRGLFAMGGRTRVCVDTATTTTSTTTIQEQRVCVCVDGMDELL